jgi:predicted dienelactone hydrolase
MTRVAVAPKVKPVTKAGDPPMPAGKLLLAIALCLTATSAQAAGFRVIDVPADTGGPALTGAIWYPCSAPPGEVDLGPYTLPVVKDCPIAGDKLPLVVISHGRRGGAIGHHDTAETLADAGFVVAAINHPGDTTFDASRTEELSVFITRPADIKRLIDFMLGSSPAAPTIDARRIGVFGFSRGGYTGLVAVGAEPRFQAAGRYCQGAPALCEEISGGKVRLTHDPRIKAAVIADPLSAFFDAGSLAAVKVPVQLWRSQNGGDGVTPESVAAVAKLLPANHEYHVVANAAHFAFMTPCPAPLAAERPELCTDAPGFDRVAFHQQFNAAVLAFFRQHLMQ